ncbi:hypothetical protein [Sciscionella marina]|uniref:hypothetical protein n=1 Tax=Sciscionella marina TaxID=508770 RepID=UPI00036D02EE|nr:hypothetical protein [Sciscionella marina]
MRAITPGVLRTELAELIADRARPGRCAVLVDAAPVAEPERFAEDLVDPLRERGFPVQRVDARDFLLPASLRFERGREDPDSYYEDWLDAAGLRREVFDRWTRTGPCSVLPSLWDARTDRATRAGYREQPEHAILLLAGTLLLHKGFPTDLTVHLGLSGRTLERELPAQERWTLPAFRRYRAEFDPEASADVLVRFDHPDRPAVRP